MTEPGRWTVVLAPSAERDLRRISEPDQRRVKAALDRYAETSRGDIRKLTGSEREWRLRVGTLRVRFERRPETRHIVVLRIRHRREAYRD